MDKEKLLRDIGSDLETMQAHIKRLRKKKQDIHQLDVDLLLDKTRQLYEKLLNIDKTDESNQKAIVLPETMPEAEIPEVAFSTQGIGSGALVVEEKEEEKLKEEIEVKKEGKEVKKK